MATSKNGGKLILFVLVALIGGATGFGYFTHATPPKETPKDASSTPAQHEILAPKPSDIILGDNNALVTMVEYSSLSCPHCAHFHETVLPTIEKEFITPGKLKLVVRHFPLNDPAVKGAQIVECAGQNGLKRESFVKVLFDMQAQWAFSDAFVKDLKQIALVGGIDSAAFDSCLSDKTIETRVLTMRQEAETKLGVNSTPTFYINGEKFTGEPSVDGMRGAISAALAGGK